ncbi:hypothetical protein F0A17_01680 [Billgrantia pellis]|uniref:Toxin CptA n=1 Tax=Billgrantia pellis TaxID=2606936 RepID=A0A7V7KI41_9GAMM|nr:hypothetical protein [Halomonas pellis]KAA0014390.1 hypothetical protein F0A17_01680 [Halomonas pellis]
MALVIVGTLAGYASTWLLGLGVVWLVTLNVWLRRRQLSGELRLVPQPDTGWRWLWRPDGESELQPVTLRCIYLGPWLMGLVVDGRSLWLWPDSAPSEALRQLRRALIRVS